MLAGQTISVLILFLLICAVNANAAIYKWKDEKGKIHFTDNPIRVPKAYREKPFIKGSAVTPLKTKNTEDKKLNDRETVEDKGGLKEETKEEKKEETRQEGLTEEQRLVAENALSFLETDIVRYEKYYNYPPSRSKFRLIKLAVKEATPQKQDLLDQVSTIDLPLFNEIAGFLETSIAADEKAQKIMPTTLPSARQTFALMKRLKSDTQQEKQLLEKLNAELNSAE
ncbi:MAG: DUF4124 domain-containing protein [Nitrospinae bacterium]|nr:DUF4124 domain-containing protein [Nitrospinota bacterium]